VTERLIVFLDTLLVCLGLTMTVAAVGPLLESATTKIWHRRARPLQSRKDLGESASAVVTQIGAI